MSGWYFLLLCVCVVCVKCMCVVSMCVSGCVCLKSMFAILTGGGENAEADDNQFQITAAQVPSRPHLYDL